MKKLSEPDPRFDTGTSLGIGNKIEKKLPKATRTVNYGYKTEEAVRILTNWDPLQELVRFSFLKLYFQQKPMFQKSIGT